MPPTQPKPRSKSNSKNSHKRTNSTSSTSRKRSRSPGSPHERSPSNTRKNQHKSRKMSSTDLDALTKLIQKSNENIQNQIESSQNTLVHKFNDLATSLSTEVTAIKTSVDEFKFNVSNDISELKTHLSLHEHRINNTEDDIQRLKRSLDLRIVGFPTKENENLVTIFEKISNEIGYASHSSAVIPSIERMMTRNRTTNQMVSTNTIMIHFPMLTQKQTFYSHYLNKIPFKPEKFGLSPDNRIVIGENLTTTNAKVFKAAQSMKKEKKIAQVFTEDGLIKMRLKKGKQEPTHVVRTVTELESIVMRYEQLAATKATSTATNVTPIPIQPQQPHTVTNNQMNNNNSHQSSQPPAHQLQTGPNANTTNITQMETDQSTAAT